MRPGVARVRRVYPHPPALVWRALTTPELLERWLMPNDFAPVVGHRFTFRTEPGPGFDGIVHCEVLDLVEEQRLELSWKGGPLDTKVVFELREVGGGTELSVVHSGFRGLAARLVQRLLAIGNRTMYGRRLPALLRELAGGAAPSAEEGTRSPPTEDPSGNACMERRQGVWVTLLSWITRRS